MSKKLKGALPTPKKTRAAKTTPTHEEIALRAYEIYLERGGASGDALPARIARPQSQTQTVVLHLFQACSAPARLLQYLRTSSKILDKRIERDQNDRKQDNQGSS